MTGLGKFEKYVWKRLFEHDISGWKMYFTFIGTFHIEFRKNEKWFDM